jgi:hypothetical protein
MSTSLLCPQALDMVKGSGDLRPHAHQDVRTVQPCRSIARLHVHLMDRSDRTDRIGPGAFARAEATARCARFR